ncbi:MAG: hypothetical protein GXY36_10025 [Chloroflexi bacterium]|mgnify:CR=1 FL=1|nr:hypothetical protein [Chloroflexota bacterium]
MKNLLSKLDRKAGQWLETVDGEMQQPVTQFLNGETLFNRASGHSNHSAQAQPDAQAPATPATNPGRKPSTSEVPCQQTLRGANI